MSDYVKYLRNMVGKSEVMLVASCCIIQNENKDILLQQRPDGKWGLPGGIMELSESVQEAAMREVFEETGLIVKIDYLQGVYSKYFAEYKNGDKAQVIVVTFCASVVSGEIRKDGKETIDLKYFKQDKMPEIFCRQHKDIIDDFIAGKRSCIR